MRAIGQGAADLTGYELTLAVCAMVRATFVAGRNPIKVVMNPKDYGDLKDYFGKPWSLLTIAGLPIEIDPECEPGKVLALEANNRLIDRIQERE